MCKAMAEPYWVMSRRCSFRCLSKSKRESLTRFNSRKYEIARELRARGVATKDANRRAEKLAGEEVKVWHCRNCSEHGTGCCGSGDIRFNVVGEGDWAVKAAQKGQGR